MVGYRNDHYIHFGRTSARLDDIANFIPARLAVPVIALAAQRLTGSGKRAFQTAVHEGAHHDSPNSGYSEAAFAGALSVKLNGPSIYHGRLVNKPYVGYCLWKRDAKRYSNGLRSDASFFIAVDFSPGSHFRRAIAPDPFVFSSDFIH